MNIQPKETNTQFFSNLLETCKTDQLIREDGKILSLGLFERLKKAPTYSTSSTPYAHFNAVCRNLNNRAFGELPLRSQIGILSRIQTLRNQTFSPVQEGDTIDRFIQEGEAKMMRGMTKKRLEDTWKELTTYVREAARNSNVKEFEYAFKQIDALMDYTFQRQDSSLIEISLEKWNSLYKKITKEQPYNRYVEEKNEEYIQFYNIGKGGSSNYSINE